MKVRVKNGEEGRNRETGRGTHTQRPRKTEGQRNRRERRQKLHPFSDQHQKSRSDPSHS